MVFLVQNVHEVEEDTIFMDNTLKELLHQKIDPSIAIAGCISTTKVSRILRESLDSPEIEEGPVKNFIVELEPVQGRKGSRLKVLEKKTTEISGLQETGFVTQVFQLIKERYRSRYDYVLLTTWDHGSGFAIFTIPDVAEPVMTGKPIRPRSKTSRHPDQYSRVHRIFKSDALLSRVKGLRGKKHLKKFRRLLTDVEWTTPAYGLTMDNLRQAILSTFGKVDVIFMRNCYMQIFDTGFVLSDVVHYLVATEGIMWFDAYNYNIWLTHMQKALPNLTPEVAASTAILGFSLAKMNEQFRISTALFGNDLSYYPALNQVMNQMIRELILYAAAKGHEEEHQAKLLKCRRQISDLARPNNPGATYQMIDARWWFIQAGELLADNAAYQEALVDFLDLLRRSVGGRRFVGSQVMGNGFHLSGIALYFPTFLRNIQRYGSFYELYYALHAPYKASFTRESLWDEFIGFLFLGFRPHLLRRPAGRR